MQIGLNVLDPESRRVFESENIETNFPKFETLIKFIKNKCSVLQLAKNDDLNQSLKPANKPRKSFVTISNGKPKLFSYRVSPSSFSSRAKGINCLVCNQGYHRIAACPKFLKMDPFKHIEQVRSMKLFFACLSSMHSKSECTSIYSCQICKSKLHHSLLHFETPIDRQKSSDSNSEDN